MKKNSNLTPEQENILFNEATEPPSSSELNNEKREGSYHCANCDTELFKSLEPGGSVASLNKIFTCSIVKFLFFFIYKNLAHVLCKLECNSTSLLKSSLYPPPKTPHIGILFEKKFSITNSSLSNIPLSEIFSLPNLSL